MDFDYLIKREQLRQYRHMLKEIRKIERDINKLLKEQETVPIVKDKVKASMNEFPYTETHLIVDAPDPRRNSHLEKLLIKKKVRMEFCQKERLAVEDFVSRIRDSRTRQIFDDRFVQGKRTRDIAIEYDLTEQRIDQIIREEIFRQLE